VSVDVNFAEMRYLREHLRQLIASFAKQLAHKRPTEQVVAVIAALEEDNTFSGIQYAFERSVFSPRLATFIERHGRHWVSDLEGGRDVQWQGPWMRIEQVAEILRRESPQGFRRLAIRWEPGQTKQFWALTRSVRLDDYGRKRVVIAYEREDLSDPALFLFSSALHWEGNRVLEMWNYRWLARLFH
jgi:hypothetical protein